MEDVVLESRTVESLGLTTEQAAIVADRGRDMLVTAGAGGGKTRVLVERYVSLLQEHRIPEIAAVTFTDAAAMEMRERVRRELLDQPEMASHRADIDEAVIGTIHSLCYMILREHPVEASIDPAARILSEDGAEFELYQACIDALEDAADADDHRALALRELSVYHATLNLPPMVERRDEVDAAFRALPGGHPGRVARTHPRHVGRQAGTGRRRATPTIGRRRAMAARRLQGPRRRCVVVQSAQLSRYLG